MNTERSPTQIQPPKTREALLRENARLRQRIGELEQVIRQADKSPSAAPTEIAVSQALLEAGCARFGRFTLKSGLMSPVYLDLRRLSSYPEALRIIAAAYQPILEQLTFDHMAAVPYTALPIGTALSLATGNSMLYPRLEIKDHGTKASVEGVFREGDMAIVVDDVATTGLSTTKTIERLKAVGLNVQDVVVLVDREQGAAEALAKDGYRLHAVTTLRKLLEHWRAAGAVSDEQLADLDLPVI